MYQRKPILLRNIRDRTPVVSLEEHVRAKAKKSIQMMLRTKTRDPPKVSVGDFV